MIQYMKSSKKQELIWYKQQKYQQMKSTNQHHFIAHCSTDSESPTHARNSRQSPHGQHKSPPFCNHEMFQQGEFNETAKKMNATIRTLEDKVESVEALVKKKTFKIDMKHGKADLMGGTGNNGQPGAQEPQQKSVYSSSTNYGEVEHPLRKDDSEPELRTSCPNVFRKFEQTSLRNTTHSKNLQKIGHIIADIKKQQITQESPSQGRGMKKNPITYYNQPNPNNLITSPKTDKEISTPQYKKIDLKNNFKSLNEIWTHKINTRQKNKQNEQQHVEKSPIINGFEIGQQLGKGKFGEVYLGRHAETGTIVALKKIVKSKVKQYKMVEQFKAEIRLHSSLDHPNIVKFYGFFQHADDIYLILEYINGGTLFDYITEKDMLSVGEAAEYLKDVVEALTYMHDRSIAHRDIKPENIVLTTERVAKLCDFGWSALVESSRKTYCGTFDYAPPEILQHKKYDESVDIWCIGVLTFEILTGHVPFQGQKRKQIMQKILSVDKNRIDYPVQLPEDAKNFIELLVQKDPEQRPKCRQLLKHPFFVNNLKPTKIKRN